MMENAGRSLASVFTTTLELANHGVGTTVTLAVPWTGLHVDAVGELWVADIGILGVFERAGKDAPHG